MKTHMMRGLTEMRGNIMNVWGPSPWAGVPWGIKTEQVQKAKTEHPNNRSISWLTTQKWQAHSALAQLGAIPAYMFFPVWWSVFLWTVSLNKPLLTLVPFCLICDCSQENHNWNISCILASCYNTSSRNHRDKVDMDQYPAPTYLKGRARWSPGKGFYVLFQKLIISTAVTLQVNVPFHNSIFKDITLEAINCQLLFDYLSLELGA